MEQPHKPGDSFSPDNSSVQPSSPAPATPTPSTPSNPAPTLPTPQPTQPQPSYSVPEPQQVEKSKKRRISKKLKTALVTTGTLVLLGGAGAFAYFGVYLPSQPENVLKSMLANTLSAKTLKSAGDLSYISGETETNVRVTSAFDLNDLQNPKGLTKFSVDAGTTDILFDAVLVENELYFKVDGLQGLTSLLQAQLGEAAEDYMPVINLLDGIFGHWFVVNESLMRESVDFGQLQEEQITALVEPAKDIELLGVVAVHVEEEIRGQQAYHYTVLPNDEGFKQLLDSMVGKKIANNEITHQQVDELKNYINENPTTEEDTADVWIYKGSKQLAKLVSESTEEDIDGTLSVEFFDYGEPLTIEKPADAKSLLELASLVDEALREMFGGSLSFPENGGFDGSIPGDTTFTPSTLGEILVR